jgi:hypothetical protein
VLAHAGLIVDTVSKQTVYRHAIANIAVYIYMCVCVCARARARTQVANVSSRTVAYREGVLGVQTLPEIPKFYKADLPVPWKIYP